MQIETITNNQLLSIYRKIDRYDEYISVNQDIRADKGNYDKVEKDYEFYSEEEYELDFN